jgi:hypothetical protein
MKGQPGFFAYSELKEKNRDGYTMTECRKAVM